jgi:hypothetical protein
MQNPEFTHPDYEALPYGVRPDNIDALLHNLVSMRSEVKTTRLWNSPISISRHRVYRPTWWSESFNSSRVGLLNYTAYCRFLQSAFHVTSPGGDRYDTYRHWEILAFGSIPVTNLPLAVYQKLFCDDMVFISSAVEAKAIDNFPLRYHLPNRRVFWSLSGSIA